jgi:hypothetical protein
MEHFDRHLSDLLNDVTYCHGQFVAPAPITTHSAGNSGRAMARRSKELLARPTLLGPRQIGFFLVPEKVRL